MVILADVLIVEFSAKTPTPEVVLIFPLDNVTLDLIDFIAIPPSPTDTLPLDVRFPFSV